MSGLTILYVNSNHDGGRYIREAESSAASFRRFLPDAVYVLFTDKEDLRSGVFDDIRTCRFVVPEALKDRTHFNGQMLAKQRAMQEMETEKILVLGSDTYALKPDVSEMIRLLDRFDIAVAHAPLRINTEQGNSPIPEIPRAFPEFNCDVILYRNSTAVRELVASWHDAYQNDLFSHPHDQGTFRYLVYKSDLRIATLPPEYNYRGYEYREDTVILQNRYALDGYPYPGRWGALRKVWDTIRRKRRRSF